MSREGQIFENEHQMDQMSEEKDCFPRTKDVFAGPNALDASSIN